MTNEWSKISLDHIFPVVVVQDRHEGEFSGGTWFAIATADCPAFNGPLDPTRITYCLDEGPNGDDDEAREFWQSPPAWVAAGSTPQDAIDALLRRP